MMKNSDTEDGRVGCAETGSREPDPSGSGPPGFDPARVKYVQDLVAALSEQSNRAAKAERQVRDLSADNARLRADRDKIGPLVEFFRGDGYWPFGHRGDYEGWSPEETAIHFLRTHPAHYSASAIEAATAGETTGGEDANR